MIAEAISEPYWRAVGLYRTVAASYTAVYFAGRRFERDREALMLPWPSAVSSSVRQGVALVEKQSVDVADEKHQARVDRLMQSSWYRWYALAFWYSCTARAM